MKKIISTFLVVISLLALYSCAQGVEIEISFIAGGEVYDTVKTGRGEIINIPEDPTMYGYTFDGWYFDEGEWCEPFTAGALLDTPISSEMKLSVYAKWVINMAEHTHTPSEWIEDTAPTCKTIGFKHKECTECGAVVSSEEISKLSHTPSEWIEDTAPTCKAVGSRHRECTVCGAIIETEEIEKLTTHIYTDDTDKDCDICGTEREVACQHINTTLIPGKSASCTEAGLTDGLFCNDCKETITVQTVIPASHKEEIIPRIEPDCNNCGWTEGRQCSVCYEVFSEPEMIRPLGCKGGDWVIEVAATEYSFGAKVKYCTRCGEQMQFENIPATVVGLNAEHSVDNDGNTYITILNAYGNLTKTTLNIPDTLWGFSVGAIADEAFAGYSNITKVVIPDSVTSIGSGAFRDCTSLKTVIIGENVNYIGAHAFTRCPISSITFKNPNGWWMSTSSTTTSGKTISSSVVGDGVSMCKYLSVSYDDYYYRRR